MEEIDISKMQPEIAKLYKIAAAHSKMFEQTKALAMQQSEAFDAAAKAATDTADRLSFLEENALENTDNVLALSLAFAMALASQPNLKEQVESQMAGFLGNLCDNAVAERLRAVCKQKLHMDV